MDQMYRGKINQKPISEFVFFAFCPHNSIKPSPFKLEAENLLNIVVTITRLFTRESIVFVAFSEYPLQANSKNSMFSRSKSILFFGVKQKFHCDIHFPPPALAS